MVNKSNKVLVFTTAFRPMIGGSELALEEIINRLPDVFFDIITPRHKREFQILESGSNFNIHRVGPGIETAKVIFPILGFFKAVKLMRDNDYDAVHAYQASYGGGAAWVLKLFSPKLPLILTMQEGKDLDRQPLLLNWFRRLIISKADIITVISNFLKDYVGRSSKNKKVILIPNGVNLDRFQITGSKLQKNFDFQGGQNKNIIITISRLVSKNGLSDLIKAFHILRTKYHIPNTKLMIIGDGPQREELFELTNTLGLKYDVDFLGSVTNENICGYLSSASVFVRPSLSEGLGTAFLEAMAAGVPIIGTPTGGIKDFLTDGETGLFCKVGDSESIAEKINLVLSDNTLRERLVSNGRKLVEEKYDWNKITAEFNKIYNDTTI